MIAYGNGGITEPVIPFGESEVRSQKSEETKPTGIFIYEQTPAALINAIKRFEALENQFDPHEIRRNAERFSVDRFCKELKHFISKKINDFFT